MKKHLQRQQSLTNSTKPLNKTHWRFLIVIFCYAFLLDVNAQTFNGNITLGTQAQVDNFNYTVVTGHLCVYENSRGEITNIDGLSELTSVGSLRIVQNKLLYDINSLSNLISAGNVEILNNNSLDNLDGLKGLTSIKSLVIFENASLRNVNGLSGLDSIDGELSFVLNPLLETVDSLINVKYVAGILQFNQNSSLMNLDGLANLKNIGGSLDIYVNNKIVSISGLSNLETIGEGIGITGNPLLENIDALSKIKGLSFNLYINGNNSLKNIDGLSSIEYVTAELIIDQNPLIENVDGLSSLKVVYSPLSISRNSNLKNLNGLANLEDVVNVINIWENPSLTEFCGLYHFFTTGLFTGTVFIKDNAVNPTKQQIINNGPCPATKIFSGNLTLTTQEEIDNFDYSAVSGTLLITEETKGSIISLDGLYGLESVRKLQIINNSSLSNIEGLSNLTSVSESVEIKNNGALTGFCGIHSLLNSGFAGEVYIVNNGSNPSAAEILNSGNCLAVTGVDEASLIPDKYDLSQNYPNPFNPATAIEYSLPEAAFVKLDVFNTIGEVVKTLVNGNLNAGYHKLVFDASGIPSGIYIYKITAGDFTDSKKLVILK